VGDTVSVFSGRDNDDDKQIDEVDEEETDDNNPLIEPLGWKLDTPFQGIDTTKRFQQALKTRSSRRDDGEIVTGMKVLKTSANSPAKAWRLIVTTTILEKIVEYSNDCGKLSIGTGSFTEICRSDIIDFICVLFVSSIQKRKDKFANWWSDNPLKENPVVKRIMTG
jgi:hypothetical protein